MMVYPVIPHFFNPGNCQNIMSLISQMFLKLMLMTVGGVESHIWGLPGSTPHVLPRVSAVLKEVNFCPAEIYWNGGGITRYVNNECYQII